MNASTFLYTIGLYNLIALPALAAMLSHHMGDTFLRRWCQLICQPYELGRHGPLWLWWSILCTAFFGWVNVRAASWPAIAQRDLVIADLALYAAFTALTIGALRSPRYARGMWFNIPLFGFWAGWAALVLCDLQP